MSAHSLTTVQQAILFDQLMTPNIPCYNLGAIWQFSSDIDITLLEKSVNQVLTQHDALRTRLTETEKGITQNFHHQQNIIINYRDFSLDDNSTEKAKEYLHSEYIKPFPLYGELLWRSHFARINDQQSLWLISAHHLMSDGTSFALLGRLIISAYEQLTSGTILPSQKNIGYLDFIQRDTAYLQSERYTKDRDFWFSRFASVPASTLEPERFLAYQSCEAAPSRQITRSLPLQRFQQIADYAEANGASVMHVMLALVACLHYRLWPSDSLTVGVPVHNRSGAAHKQTLGMFSSMIPVLITPDPEQPFSALVQQVVGELRRCYRHQRYPIAELNRQLHLSQQGRRQLYNVTFSLERFSADNELDGKPVKVTALHHGHEQMPLAIYLRNYHEHDDPLLEFNFNQAWFSASQAEKTVERLYHLLEQVLQTPDSCPVSRLPLLLPSEQLQLAEWNNTAEPWDLATSLHRQVEQQVERTPQALALCDDKQQLTYRELNQRANQLARHLQSNGIAAEDRVAVCASRSNEMVIALLAIVKAGGAWVPLDPDLPAERLRYMLSDSGAVQLLLDDSGEPLLSALPPGDIPLLHLQRDAVRWQEESCDNLADDGRHPQHSLAYVLYTSGSTGKPKGVMNEHGAIVNRLWWMQKAYQLTAEDRVLQKTPFSFDVSVWEFFWPLMTGAQLVMAKPGGHKDPDYLCQMIEKHRITTLHFVPSMLQLFLRYGAMGQCRSLRQIFCSGEALPLAAVQRSHEQLPWTALHNLYGPTEAAVDVSEWHCLPDDPRPLIPIGRPISNTQLHVVDAHMQALPPGIAGELCIGGVQVARGYINRPELTAERFIADPFSNNPGARLYKTGDLARWLDDGSIEYLGRNDFQLKIRGLRIEAGEIEQQICQYPGVEDAIVMACDDDQGDKRLVAWLVAPEQADLINGLRRHLQSTLPDYMVPAELIRLNSMPLSANGKLDRRALPKPPARGVVRIDKHLPLSKDEQRLAEWWKEILSVEHIARDDDFFTLGGHSIHAIQLMVRLRRKGIWVEINTLYAHSTLASQALAIRNYTDAQQRAPDEVVNPIQKLIAQLNHAPEAFRLLQPLNSSTVKDRVWMVHPSVVGSEIYSDLAQALSDKLSVIGINNYNLYHQPQIASLEALAGHYLQEMLASGLTQEQPVRLLGWSLGGNIALEIASQLERHGYRDIHVCLLDTVYQTEFQFSAQAGTLGSILQMIGIEEDAAQRALMAEQTDILLGQQPVSAPLQHTRITLFKAMQFATPGEYESDEGQKMLAMADNGLAALGASLQLMPMEANHFSIIHCHHEIGAALLSTAHPSHSADIPEMTRMKRRA